MSTLQRTFDFDMATLNACIAKLQPKPLRTLFRGLLFAAAQQPWLISDIDADGYVIMTAPITTIAAWAGVSERAIQKNKLLIDGTLVTHSAGPNTASEWMFRLQNVLPVSAVGWFVDLVENAKSSPRTFEKFTPNFCAPRGELLPEVHPKVHPELLNHTSMCLVLNTASLASLAGCCEKFGIAVTDSATTWESLSVDPEGLKSPAVIESLYELATASGTIQANATTRNRWFTLAAIASRKDTPWNWFRRAVLNGWLLTTTPSNVDAANGRKLRRQADELRAATARAEPRQPPTETAISHTTPLSDDERARLITSSKFGRFLKSRPEPI